MRTAALVVAILGAAVLGLFLFRSSPRDVTLVYDLGGGGVSSLQVMILKNHEVVRRATFSSPGPQVRHVVRLTDGVYRIAYQLDGSSRAVAGAKDITVSTSQTIVLPVRQ